MPAPAPALNRYVSRDDLTALIRRARDEDMGPNCRDVTSELFIPADHRSTARLVSRASGRIAGLACLKEITEAYDPAIGVTFHTQDGQTVSPGEAVATLTGPTRSLLSAERVLLNLLCHLSGVATLTARYVEQIAGTKAQVYDTRKTIPGLRGLQKYAVACGGGKTHRMGLYDAVLLKDNHLSPVVADGLSDAVRDAVQRCREHDLDLKFVMIEVDTLDQLEQVLPTGVDIVLLDNMTTQQLASAVAMRDRLAPGVELEASGGVTLQTIRAIAETGVDRISVGALTHSAPALDLGLDMS